MQKNRIIFMGSPLISSEYLQVLVENNFNIIGVYTQPPRPKGRGMSIQNSPVHNTALNLNIPVFYPENFSNKKVLESFYELKSDLVIVMAYGKILPEEILSSPKFGCINIHVSLLPRWRGAAPIEHTLLSGDKKTGVTIFKIVKSLDSGPIISQAAISVNMSLNKKDLFEKLNEIGKNLLIEILPNYLNNKIILKEQIEENATYASKINTNITKINFYEDAQSISNKIRAFSPKPGAWFFFKNQRFKIINCHYVYTDVQPSIIINDNFHIGCKNGIIVPLTIQREGKKPMEINEFLKGFKFTIGQQINA